MPNFRASVGHNPSINVKRANPITLSGSTIGLTIAPAVSSLVNVNFDSPPSSTVNGGVYTGITGSLTLQLANGAGTRFEHVTGAEAWGGSGGCAKFNHLTTDDGSGGCLRSFTLNPTTPWGSQLNIRFLQKWNAAWGGTGTSFAAAGANNLKGNIFFIGGQRFWTQEKAMNATVGYFQLAQSYADTLYRVHGDGLSCATIASSGYQGAGCDATSSKGPVGPFLFGLRNNEWVCFEYELTTSGRFTIFITTADRVYDGSKYMEATNIGTGTIAVDGVSGMHFFDQGQTNGGSIWIDEFVAATSRIGPPAGF